MQIMTEDSKEKNYANNINRMRLVTFIGLYWYIIDLIKLDYNESTLGNPRQRVNWVLKFFTNKYVQPNLNFKKLKFLKYKIINSTHYQYKYNTIYNSSVYKWMCETIIRI